MNRKDKLINCDLNKEFPQAGAGEGIYLFDTQGRRYIDGCSGALVANLGHGLEQIGRAMTDQMGRLSYVYRYHFSSPAAEELAQRYCNLTETPMGGVYFANSGSEANEVAVKLARVRHLAAGERGRHKIVSRWQSYHGITMGALAWTGMPARRADFDDYLGGGVHIPPAYCYRCWFGGEPGSCSLECARALETALLGEGPETVAAFLIEPVVGAALAAAVPPAEYFREIREICDRYGVLFIVDEVMTGAGRTGGRFFASDHFAGRPDIIAFGKGVGGGYYPLAGALVSQETAETMASGPGGYSAGQSYSGHPVGMAAGRAVLDYMEEEGLLARAAARGDYLGKKLEELKVHPSVGDIRGMGLMRGLELVRDKETKESFEPGQEVFLRLYRAARGLGLLVLPSAGCDRGRSGDTALLGPPLIIGEEEIDRMVEILDEALGRVEQEVGM